MWNMMLNRIHSVIYFSKQNLEIIMEFMDMEAQEEHESSKPNKKNNTIWSPERTKSLTDFLSSYPNATAKQIKQGAFKGDMLTSQQIQSKLNTSEWCKEKMIEEEDPKYW